MYLPILFFKTQFTHCIYVPTPLTGPMSSQIGFRPSRIGFRPGQPGLASQPVPVGQASDQPDGQTERRTDKRTDGWMDNLPIIQDFVPYRGRCPKSRAGQGNR